MATNRAVRIDPDLWAAANTVVRASGYRSLSVYIEDVLRALVSAPPPPGLCSPMPGTADQRD